MPLTEIKKEADRRMHASLEAFRNELKHLRTGRASIGPSRRDSRRVLRHAPRR